MNKKRLTAKKRLAAIMMSVLMVLTMLPNVVFAETTTEMLGGRLKVSGIIMIGRELRADYTYVTPTGVTDEDVTFEWTRNDAMDGGQMPTVVGTEKSYFPNETDYGYTLTLKITGLMERGLSGELSVTTNPVAQTEEEAASYPQDNDAAFQDNSMDSSWGTENTEWTEEGNDTGWTEESSEWTDAGTDSGWDTESTEWTDAGAAQTFSSQTEDTDASEWIENVNEDAFDDTEEVWQVFDEGGNEISVSGTVTTPNGLGTLEFGAIDQNTEDMSLFAQTVTLTNNGTQTLNFLVITPTDFFAEDVAAPLEPGSSVEVKIYPRENLSAGAHEEQITYLTQEGIEFAFTAAVEITESTDTGVEESADGEETVEIWEDAADSGETGTVDATDSEEFIEILEEAEEPNESEEQTTSENLTESENTENSEEFEEYPVPEEVADDISGTVTTPDGTGTVDFGTVTEGTDTSALSQVVVLTNTGNVTLNFNSIAPEHFYVKDALTLEPGEYVELDVYPRSGLTAGSYNDTIEYTTTEGFSFVYDAIVTIVPEETEDPQVETPTPTPEEDPQAETPTPTPEETPQAETPTPTPEETPQVETPTPTPEETPTPIPTVTPVVETPTPTPTPEITVEPEPVYQLQISSYSLDFGVYTVGYTEAPASQTVTITNKGDRVSLQNLTSQYFEIGSFSKSTLEKNESATFTVRPKTGLPVGGYNDILSLTSTDGNDLGNVTAVFRVKSQKIYSLYVSPSSVTFGSVQSGYSSAPYSQTISIRNTGNDTIHLQQPTSGYYVISRLSSYTLQANAVATFTIRPRTGLAVGSYHETVTIPNAEGVQATVTADFTVASKSVVLTAIAQPSAITGLDNGTPKTEEGLKLPSTVIINTTSGRMRAGVTWRVSQCSYDPSVTTEQKFSVKGDVTLPSGVVNSRGISLVTSINVAVNAKDALVANPDYNQISGITSGSIFTLGSKITFTAVGAGMQNQSPNKGDVRYVPTKWNVVEDRSWTSAPYSATFRIGQEGSYKLKVTFSKQKFDGNSWVNTGDTDVKSVDFVVKSGTNTPTPTPGGRHAVETGDNTTILPYIVVLIFALAVIAGVIVYLRKRKK